MKLREFNKLYSEQLSYELQFEDINKERRRLWFKRNVSISGRRTSINDIGTAIIGMKVGYGRSWKRDFSEHGFAFNYRVACGYIQSGEASPPQGPTCGKTSNESWAIRVKEINKLHAERMWHELQDEADLDEERRLREREHCIFSEWRRRVVDIAKSLIELKAGHGRGWKRDFPKFGLPFNYKVACRYIACSKVPWPNRAIKKLEEWEAFAAEVELCRREAAAEVEL